jgi:hypothetical protein
MVFPLSKVQSLPNDVPGACAKCGEKVWEALFVLDDAYNVWGGKCPYCEAINLLSTEHGLRGYDSREMHLVLPYDEEAKENGLPSGCPTRGKYGQPPKMHGSPLGELCHRLTSPDDK